MPLKAVNSGQPLVRTALGLVLVLCATAHAQPPTTPYGTSGTFVLNTNRIGSADSGLLAVSPVPDAPGARAVVALGDPMPNPFNPRVTIPFSVGRRGAVELGIYDLRGRLVRGLAGGYFAAGDHNRQWDGRDDRGAAMPTGVYLVRIKLDGALDTRKISLVK